VEGEEEEHERRNDFGSEKSFARARRNEEEEGDIVNIIVVRAENEEFISHFSNLCFVTIVFLSLHF
jgi:hypothetical protein